MNNSNLRWYQWITTISKKFGGPIPFLLSVFTTGGVVFLTGEKLIKRGRERISEKETDGKEEESLLFNVTSEGECKGGLKLSIGDKFKVLATDGDAVLIEKIGDSNNPYFASAEFLSAKSDFQV